MIYILNCDFDDSIETNGGFIISRLLKKEGFPQVTQYACFLNEFPTHEELTGAQGIIITGSRASVSDPDSWISQLRMTIRDIDQQQIPCFGICFGFQAIAHTFGGIVASQETYDEGFKVSTLVNTHSFLFRTLPTSLYVYQSHGEAVQKVPREAKIIAHGPGIDAFELRKFCAVQFHPEISAAIAARMAHRDKKKISPILAGVPKEYALPQQMILNFVKNSY